MTKAFMRGPDNCGGLSYAGVNYEADEDGVIEVPPEAVDAAFSHGFALLSAKTRPKPLAKAAKGGEPEDDDGGEPKKIEEVKPAQKGAKAAKGGEQ